MSDSLQSAPKALGGMGRAEFIAHADPQAMGRNHRVVDRHRERLSPGKVPRNCQPGIDVMPAIQPDLAARRQRGQRAFAQQLQPRGPACGGRSAH